MKLLGEVLSSSNMTTVILFTFQVYDVYELPNCPDFCPLSSVCKRPGRVQLYSPVWIWDVWHCPLEWQSNQTFPLETGAKCCSRRGWLLIFSVSGDGAARLTRLGCLNKNFSANGNVEKTLKSGICNSAVQPFPSISHSIINYSFWHKQLAQCKLQEPATTSRGQITGIR